MQLWNMKALGVSSEDFLNQDSMTAPKAFYGTMWKFAKDRTQPQSVHSTEVNGQRATANDNPQGFLQGATDEKSGRSTPPPPLDNHLVTEARAQGQPLAPPDAGWTEDHAKQQAEANAVQASNAQTLRGETTPAKFSEAQLSALTKTQLQDIAASVGVSNLNQAKGKLIESILGKQI